MVNFKAKQHDNFNQLSCFSGIANYYNKFVPSLAEIVYPVIYPLLEKSQQFLWTKSLKETLVIEDIESNKT